MTTSSIEFRQATINDAINMDILNRQCLPENYSLSDWKHILHVIPKYSFVAYDDKKLAGYVLGTISGTKFKSEAFIASVAVHMQYRGQGIAEKLLKLTIENIFLLGDNQQVSLNVRISNFKAQNLYEKLFFTKNQLLQQYYSDKEDAFLMILTKEDYTNKIKTEIDV